MSPPGPKKGGESRRALAEAARWRLMGLLLERPRPGWHEEVEALAREVESPELRSAAEASRRATEGSYLSLLGPGGSVSPREVAYRGREDPGRLLSDIAAFYEAFAFSPDSEDPIDHIAVEAGFVGYLHMKEAYALAQGDEEAASVTAEALGKFLEDHLGTFAEPFARRLESLESSGASYLAETAGLLLKRLEGPRD